MITSCVSFVRGASYHTDVQRERGVILGVNIHNHDFGGRGQEISALGR